jgi:DNA-binding transcriptional ArsR family regulator
MERSKALTAFAALAHEARLDLIRLVMPMGEEGLSAGEIAKGLGLSASGASFHLAALETAGLIRSRKVARNVFYTVDRQRIGGIVSYLMNDCCGADPQVWACCSAPSKGE